MNRLPSLDAWGIEAAALGIWRSLEPAGALVHAARRVDAQTPATEHEAEIDVELLAVDATSYRAIREHANGDPDRIAALISEIVTERGKLQNPWTGSGGVLMGRVGQVGARYGASPMHVGELVVPLASLIAVPLALDAVGPVDPASAHVPVRGRAIVTGAMEVARVPGDLDPTIAITALDVYPSASYARSLASPGDHVLILGAGHAGLLALAAAREAVGSSGKVSVVDLAPAALSRARALGCDVGAVQADVTAPLSVAGALADAGRAPADVTLLCTTVPGAEGTAMLATARDGQVVFFSTATSFAAAALGADAIGSRARLIIPNGLTDDRGEYAFGLIRSNPGLRAAFEQ